MQKTISVLLAFSLFSFSTYFISINKSNVAESAGGYIPTITGISGSPAIANNQATVTITVLADSGSSYMVTGYPICITVSGNGNILSSSTANTTNGYAYFTLKSSVAETKTVNAVSCENGSVESTATASFTAPPPSPTTTQNTSTKQQSTPTPTPAPAPTPKPVEQTVKPIDVSSIQVNNQSISKIKDVFTSTTDKPIIFKGDAIPNGIVTIYIYSEPKKFTTIADPQGKWSLSVVGLPVGYHHAEAEITDPATKKTSPKVELMKFSIKEPAKTQAQTADVISKPKSKFSTLFRLLIISFLALFAIVLVAFIVIKKKQQRTL